MSRETWDAKIGSQIYMEVDGYYVWAPDAQSGFLDAHYLRCIAARLDQMNAKWDAEVQAGLKAIADRDDTCGCT